MGLTGCVEKTGEAYSIRAMTVEDINAVHRIELLCFPTPWSQAAFEDELVRNALAVYSVIELDGAVVGYGGMWSIIDELHITNIAIDPAHRRKGLGRALVRALVAYGEMRHYKHMTLEARVGNAAAVALYSEMGFEAVGIRPGYYVDTGEDALIMWRTLGSTG